MVAHDRDILISRRALEQILSSIHRGNCCLVVGPRYRGKSELMRKAAEALENTGFYRIAYFNMRDLTQADSREFYRNLYETIHLWAKGSNNAVNVEAYSASDFRNAMLELMAGMEFNLLLLIDDLEFAAPNLISLLLSSLRSVFTTISNQPGPRFQVIVAGTVNLHQLALKGVSRFEGISELVLVDDMDLQEARTYAAHFFSQEAIHVPDQAMNAFLHQTSTDSVLIRFLAQVCIEQTKKESETTFYADMLPEAIAWIVNHKANHEVVDALNRIEEDPELLSCYLEIVQHGEMQMKELPLITADRPNALDLCGVFRRRERGYSIKSPLWRTILENHFTSAHCAQLYAIAGYWHGAIDYYQKAIHKDKIDQKSELFGVTINGMHASEDAQQAFDILSRGLHACYPDCEIGIYQRTESVLSLSHYFPGRENENERLPQEIQLEDYDLPEVEALDGPDYSKISSQQKNRFLIPLRMHSGAYSMGLVSYCGGLSRLGLYEQQDEILRIISFLHQATRAIDGRRKYSTALENAKSHSQTLESLDSILTTVLDHPHLEEEVIFRLLLAGLTANEGLGFNRAALFLVDHRHNEVIGTMGVGHLSWEQADRDWKSFPHESLKDLLDALMVSNYQYAPLHAAVKFIRFPLNEGDLFGKVQRDGPVCRRRSISSRADDLPDAFLSAIDPAMEFAVAPLAAGTSQLGFVYVDNKFTHRPIDDFQIASLSSFLTQATLVMQMARSLRVERQQSQILGRLLEIERNVNNKVTHSLQAVLDEIARSARDLMGADSTVAFSLKRTSQDSDGYYEVDRIARVHTHTAAIGRPNSKEGALKWVLSDAQIHIDDVQLAKSFPDGYHPGQSKFLKKEGIRSFVGLRLGKKEQPEGALFINWYSPHSLLENEMTILEVFAAFATAAITSAMRHEQLREDLQQRTRELQTLSNLIEASLDSRPDGELENLIKETLESLRNLTHASIVRLYVLESRDHLREYRLARGGQLVSSVLTRLKNGPVNIVLNSGESVMEKLISREPDSLVRDWLGPSSRARLAVPLLKGKNRLGAFYLETPEADLFLSDEEGREFIPYLADRLAITYYQTEIYNSLLRLLDISIMLKPGFEIKEVIRALVEGAVRAMPSISTVTAYFMNQETRQFELGHMAGVHYKEKVGRYGLMPGSIVDRLRKRGGPIFADFIEKDPDLCSPFAIRERIKSTAAMPLEVGEELLGYIFFNFRRQYFFDETRQGLLRLFAQIATIAIHRTNLQMDVTRRQSRLEAVAQITPLIARVNPDITDVYRTVLRETLKAIPRAHNACIVERLRTLKVIQSGDYRLVLKPPSEEFYHATRASTINGYEMGRARNWGIASRVIENQKAEIVPDVRSDQAYFRAIRSTRSEMCIPIEGTEQAIVLESNHSEAFTSDDLKLVELLATHVAIALNNEKQFRAQSERQARELVAHMATGIIHDVNNIISNIPDVVNELRSEVRGGGDVEAIEEYLHDLQSSANSTHRISSRLRDFVIGREFKPVTSDLGVLLRKVITDLERIKPAHIKVVYFQPQPVPKIDVDPLWVEQLFSNLLHNAFEAIPPSRPGHVQINVWNDQMKISVAIQDNGKGIPKDHRDKIFQPGFTTKEASTRLHGIGLYFCQQVAFAHHGEIKMESIPETETTFTVTFPIESPLMKGYGLA
jgi:signal transduction histidine kinase/transcriptional regulator with GAF, ATPase, and Fis domain